jgi:hypothetical protein
MIPYRLLLLLGGDEGWMAAASDEVAQVWRYIAIGAHQPGAKTTEDV